MTTAEAQRPGRERWAARSLENVRRAAECAATGLLWAAFSLPIVTSGAAWIAVARVFDAWTRDEEPPLVSTFVTTIRRRLATGLLAQAAVVAVTAIAYLDIRFAAAAHVPGARVECALVGLLAAAVIGLIQVAVAEVAHHDIGLRAGVRSALALAGSSPWLLPAAAVATIVCGALVAIIPALVLVIAGPLGYAIGVLTARARAAARAREGRP